MIILIVAFIIAVIIIILAVIFLGLCLLSICTFIIWILALFVSSLNPACTERDFADSRWEDNDGAIIEIHGNGTYNIQGMKMKLIYPYSVWDSLGIGNSREPVAGPWNVETYYNGKQEIIFEIEGIEYVIPFEIKDKDTIEYTINVDTDEYYTFTRTT